MDNLSESWLEPFQIARQERANGAFSVVQLGLASYRHDSCLII